MNKILKIGIVLDNYKILKYKNKLIEEGFNDFKLHKYFHNTSVLKVSTPEERRDELQTICEELEKEFAISKN